MNNRLINTKVAGGGGGCTDIVDNYDPFGGNGVALYQLNGDATDVSGNYNGTATNVTYGTGVFGQAGVFNGISSEITMNNTVSTALTFTASLWVNGVDMNRNSSDPSQIQTFFYNRNPYIVISQYNGNWQYTIKNSSSQNTTISYATSNFNDNEWYNIVISCNGVGGQMSFYVNGQSVGTNTAPTSTINVAPTGFIGTGGGQQYFNGLIDQVRIFNTALTPLEVEALYTEELCICDGTVDTLDILGDGSCIATYQLDGNANDLSGNYSGTPTDVSYGVGEFDLAGVFNGSSSKVDISSLSIPLNNFSYSLWFKANDTSSYQILILHENGGRSYGVQLNNDANIGSYMLNSSAGTEYLLSNSITIDTNWHNVVITKSSTQGHKIYYDGNNIATDAAFTGNLLSGNFSNFLGSSGTSGYFNGSIDQVRIFNKALSAGEVTTLYNETACTYTPKDYITTDLALDFFSKDITAASTTWTDRANSNVLTKSGSTVYNDATGLVDFTGGYWANDSLTQTLKDASGDFTLEFFGQANVANKVIASALQSSTVRGFLLLQQPSEVEGINYQTGTNSNGQSINHPFQSGLNHIVIQFDNSSFQKFYLNGVLVNTNTLNLNNPFWTAPNGFRLGSDITLPSLSSSMNMGIFRVYKGLLSEQDIITNYNWAIRQF